MTNNLIKPGQFITSTTTEQQFYPEGGPTLFCLVLVSGSVKVGTAQTDQSPVLNDTYTTYSTADEKIVISVDPDDRNLRVLGTAVLKCTY